MRHPHLSEDAARVLSRIAHGRSYDQILSELPHLTYKDIFASAAEALDLAECVARRARILARKRGKYPRLYEKWSEDEDRELAGLIQSGYTVPRMATHLGRNRGAIRSRIVKLDLVDQLSPKERAKLERMLRRHDQDA